MEVDANISDYDYGAGGYGSKYKPPVHRTDVTTCPCRGCKQTRGTGNALKIMFGEIRWIMYLKWLLWRVKRLRNHWPATHTADPDELEMEDL